MKSLNRVSGPNAGGTRQLLIRTPRRAVLAFGDLTRALAMLALSAFAVIQTGCTTACGPIRSVPTQRLALAAASPGSYTIRVQPDVGAPVDTPVPRDGNVAFDVPVTSRESTVYCFGLRVYQYPPPDTLRVIQVMCADRIVRKLSARDIGQLPTDADGYHVLRVGK